MSQTQLQKLRIISRQLLKSPGFSLAAVLMLAFGIGATTAIFSIIESVILRPLPFPESGKLVVISDIIEGANLSSTGDAGVSATDIHNYVRDTYSFENLGGYQQEGLELSGIGDSAHVNAARLTSGVLPGLGVQALMGRFFTQQEDDQKQQVVVVSYSLWKDRLHSDSHVLGSKILLDRKPYEIVGVMPRDFEFPLTPGHLNNSELWVPMSFTEQENSPGAAGNWGFSMVGRLKPGIGMEQAEGDAERVAQNTMRNFPAFMSSLRVRAIVRSLHEETIGESRALLRTLFLATGVVLLIACANLAGLLLVRAIRRRREIAVRLALGARAGVLLREAVLESLVLSVTGGLLGLAVAQVALKVAVSRLPETLPRINEIAIDWRVVSFAALLAVATGLLCGLAPAFAALRTKVNDSLKDGGRTGAVGGHARLRSALVVGEIAIALVLLAASGLLLRSFEKMRQVDLGFRPDHTLVAGYSLPPNQYSTQLQVDSFTGETLRRLQQLPGVRYAGLTTVVPAVSGFGSSTFVVEGYVPAKGAGLNLAAFAAIKGDYLQAMGSPLLLGRLFTPADNAQTQLVAIVNHKFAQHYWPGADAIGKRFRIGTPESPTPWLTIVGEVADVKQSSADEPSKEQLYEPMEQFVRSLGGLASAEDLSGNSAFIAVRTATPPEQMENAVRAVVRSVDPQLPLSQVQTMEQAVSDSEAPRVFNTAMISAFALAAVLLAALGIYSVIAFSVALRAQEMAIRMALGSQRSSILRLVFASAAKLGVAGCAIGLLGATAASHLLRSFLFNVSPFDPLVLMLAAILVMLLAAVAALLPALRAASIQPMKALRMD